MGATVAENQHVYGPKLASEILDRMAQGETLTQICRSRPEMPHPATVRGWCFDVEGFAEAYARARVLQAQAWGDELIELLEQDEMDPSVRRVKFDITKWLMSKHAPVLYGDKLTVAGDPNAPLVHVHAVQSLEQLGEEELETLEAFCEVRLAALEGISRALLHRRGTDPYARSTR